MPWLKVSDRFATHPLWARLRGARSADDRTVNEVKGFLTSCASQASGHMTDYFVDLETAEMFGKGRTELLLRQAVQAGMLQVEGRGHARRWRIVEDEDLWQMRARDDVLWERQRNRDRKNPDLIMPVLLRDGDVCRYCSVVVNWKDNRSGRGGTFDHGQPGQPATVETYFVSCKSCNSKRSDNPTADVDVPRRPAPALPYFSSASRTLAQLEKFYGRTIPHVTVERPVTDPAHPRDPAPSRTPRPSRPGTQPDPASSTARPVADTARPATTRDTAQGATPIVSEDTAHGATPVDGGDTAASATPGGWAGDTAPGATPARPGDPPDPAAPPAVTPEDLAWLVEHDALPPSWAHLTGDHGPDQTRYRSGPGVEDQVGSGREGPGQAGSGQDGTGAPPPTRRGRRGRRGNS